MRKSESLIFLAILVVVLFFWHGLNSYSDMHHNHAQTSREVLPTLTAVDTPRKKDKFIILSSQRTGSTWLLTMLEQHPEIVLETREPFALPVLHKWDSAYGHYGKHMDDWDEYIGYFEYIYDRMARGRKVNKNTKMFGIKMMYDHCPFPKRFLQYLEDRGDFEIVHHQRKNIFESSLSNAIASITQVWQQKATKDRTTDNDKMVTLKEGKVISYIQEKENLVRSWEEELKLIDIPIFESWYSRWLKSQVQISNEVLGFLGVTVLDEGLTGGHTKISKLPVYQRITNWKQICEGVAEHKDFAKYMSIGLFKGNSVKKTCNLS